jgi:ABC-2 type transport system ATP-binding protein
MEDPALVVDGLTRRFADRTAVDGLSLVIGAGELFALVGPDGAGKTTTLRMLCGVLRPNSGTARILGFDLLREAARIKPRIGYLSQRFSLYGDLTIDENVEFHAGIHDVRDFRTRRDELLGFTRLTPFRSRPVRQLSGGMKQKLALACALVHTPGILFLDEPTTGVDPVSRRDFWGILSGIQRSGTTIVMTTPYLDEAERCSRVGLLNQGRLMTLDTPQNVRSLMPGVVVELVCASVRTARRLLADLPGIQEIQMFGDRLDLVVSSDAIDACRTAVLRRLAESNVAVQGWRTVPASLENVFVSLLRRA